MAQKPDDHPTAYPEHPAAAGYRALRGRMLELWAAMPRMTFLLDLHPRELKPKD